MQNKRKYGLNNNQLKIIAMVSMLIDHMGMELFPGEEIFRIIGRIAFPIFAYMIAEGCFYTGNRRKYLLMVAGLGIGCQAVYSIVMHSLFLNILLTFTLSILTIFSIDLFLKKKSKSSLICMICVILTVIFLSLVAPLIFKETGFRFDYGFLGVILPVAVYFSPDKRIKTFSVTAIIILQYFLSSETQIYALMAIPLLLLYNGKRGKLKMKYVFYIFYPVHLALIYLIDMII